MAAGLGFKDFTTGEVLTAADVDGYLMQGVWVFASAAARDAAVTSPQEGNFAYLKDTNVTTYYTGSAWANLDTTGMTNPMTTTGDTIYSSSGSTPARLGIGSTGQVLTVAGGVPSWATPATPASGLTLVKTQTIGSGVSSVTVTDAFSSTYDNYKVIISGGSSSADVGIHMQLGSTTTGYYVTLAYNYANGGTGAFSFASLANYSEFTGIGDGCANSLTSNMEINSPYLSKPTTVFNHSVKTITTNAQLSITQGFLNNTTSYTDFKILSGSGGVTFTGGTIKVYGYQNS